MGDGSALPKTAAGRAATRQTQQAFLHDVLEGLADTPKRLPCKYFYDERGSQLFEAICEVPEYYLTRTELAIMHAHAAEMGECLGEAVMLVELGSGSGIKTRMLLEHLPRPVSYVPVDIAAQRLEQTALELTRDYPDIDVVPVCADFTGEFSLPRTARAARRVAVYFPGSTIGNFGPHEARQLLSGLVERCGSGGGLLIGIDLKKDVSLLEAAYNDSRRVTDEFNLNLLRRINRVLHADFELSAFRHQAIYNAEAGRIEMYLISRREQAVRIAGHTFHFAANERCCTEYSYKYDVDEFAELAASAGLTLERCWTDPQRFFAVLYFNMP